MRIKEKKPVNKKIKRGFLLLPNSIGGLIRWMEFAVWEMEWRGDGGGFMGGEWVETKWLDLGKTKKPGR